MPICFQVTMTDEEILRHIARTYASSAQYEPYEKDMGHGDFTVKPWIERDQGEYARRGLGIIAERWKVPT